jgi:peptidoglycan/LPS O-acetylase OafA/YrhL
VSKIIFLIFKLLLILNIFRSIVYLVIMICHTQWFGFFALKNSYQMLRYIQDIIYQPYANTPLLVDLFFVISGFLLSFNFLRNKHQINVIKASGFWPNVKLFGKIVLQRYLR